MFVLYVYIYTFFTYLLLCVSFAFQLTVLDQNSSTGNASF
jgi:hypothetical protein